MGLIQKNDEDKDYIDGVEVIGRGEGSGDDPFDDEIEIAAGETAEDISGTTARRAAENALETEADPELVGEPAGEDAPEDAPEDDAFYDDADGSDPLGLFATSAGRIYVAISVVAVVVAVIVGYMVGSGSTSSESVDTGVSSYLTEDELDTVVATWTYGGTTYSITAQEAIESQYSLETVVEDDGTYAAPTADIILTYVRNQVLLLAAEDAGITVDEDEVAEYAEDTLGSSDYEYISESYGVTEEQAEEIVTQMATIQALYSSVIPEIDAVYPSAPDEPEDEDEDAATAEYAAYIIELLGDEWDSETGTWASTDGDYYAALGDEDFTADSATYSQAITAYYVAYTLYYEAYSEASSVWTVYANELYGEADITIYGLYS